MLFGLLGDLQSYDAFRQAVGHAECASGYSCVNSIGALGRYQFMPTTLSSLGYTGTHQDFLNNPAIQDQYFDMLVQSNASQLISMLPAAQSALGSNTTLSGLIGGAHLGGVGGVHNLVYNGVDHADGNGTHISYYISLFNGYAIPGYDESGNSASNNNNNDPAHQGIPSASDVFPGQNYETASIGTGTDWTTYLLYGGLALGGILLIKELT